jgi:hypothetical protein
LGKDVLQECLVEDLGCLPPFAPVMVIITKVAKVVLLSLMLTQGAFPFVFIIGCFMFVGLIHGFFGNQQGEARLVG